LKEEGVELDENINKNSLGTEGVSS